MQNQCVQFTKQSNSRHFGSSHFGSGSAGWLFVAPLVFGVLLLLASVAFGAAPRFLGLSWL